MIYLHIEVYFRSQNRSLYLSLFFRNNYPNVPVGVAQRIIDLEGRGDEKEQKKAGEKK